jgi:hypothetical protein
MEVAVNTHSNLNFVQLPKLANDPSMDRRTRIVAQLEEQKSLLKDSTFMRSVRSWEKNEHGEKKLVEKKQRVSPKWRKQPDGSYIFFVRSGWKPIELEKGKAGILARSADELLASIDILIASVREGQFDRQLAEASVQVQRPKAKSKRAA